jgi:putative DNA primase/helicase
MSERSEPNFGWPAYQQLARFPNFVRWKLERGAKGKPTKVPYQVDGRRKASSTDPSTWTTFEAIMAATRDQPIDASGGIGYVFDGVFTFIDLDNCRDPHSGAITPWAQEIIDALSSFTEVSPSGYGLHIFVEGELPVDGKRKHPPEWESTNPDPEKRAGIEMYGHKHYSTLSGVWLNAAPAVTVIVPRQAAIDALYARFWGAPPGKGVRASERPTGTSGDPYAHLIQAYAIPSAFGLDDEEVIARALRSAGGDRFRRLFAEGDMSEYASQSEADAALVNMLLFWVADDVEQLDRLFCRSKLAEGSKWSSRLDYRLLTIGFAASQPDGSPRVEYYQGAEGGPTIHLGGVAASGVDVEHQDVDLVQAKFTLTDTGNAERLIARHGRDLRYASENKRWLVWDDTRWATDLNIRVVARAKGTLRSLLAWATAKVGAEPPPDVERQKMLEAVRDHARKSLSAPRVNGMVALAQSEPGVAVSNAELDSDPLLLNVRNGTLDLRNGELQPHRRADLLTRRTEVDFDPNADCPRWRQFLDEIFLGDQTLIDYVQRATGYSLTGNTMSRALFLLHGYGRNGKSTFLDALQGLLGDYASAVPSQTLMRKQHASIPNDVAALRGTRLVVSIETDEGQALAEALIKAMVGGTDRLTARFLYGEYFSFTPEFKVWLATNHLPSIEGSGDAIWDRVHLVPFRLRVAEQDEDRALPGKLRQELSGILNWALAGWRQYQQLGGLVIPDIIREETAKYRSESDPVRRFIEDRCELDQKLETRAFMLFSAYDTWCAHEGVKPVNQTKFGRRLGELGLSRRRSNGAIWEGIGLVSYTHTRATVSGAAAP